MSYQLYKQAVKLIERGEEVPQYLIDSIASDRRATYFYTICLIKNKKKVQKNIIERLIVWLTTNVNFILKYFNK